MVVVLIELGIIFNMAVDTKSPCFEEYLIQTIYV